MSDSQTPRTDAALHAIHYGSDRFSFPEHARTLERELNAALKRIQELEERLTEASVPICIGRPIIGHLARDGQWVSQKGNAVIAADELFRNDPYDKIEQLESENTALREWKNRHIRLMREVMP